MRLPWDRPPLSLNDRLGWAAKARTAESITDAVAWLFAKWPLLLWPIEVELVFYPGRNDRRDADNLAATLKPVVDGMVRARVLPDDDASRVIRSSQRVVLRRDDPLDASEPRLLLVITEAGRLDHYGPEGEAL